MKAEDIRGTVHASMFWRSSQRGQTEMVQTCTVERQYIYQQKDAELGTAGGLEEEQWWLTWRRNMKVVGVREEDAA